MAKWLEDARKRKFDVLVVWKLDRLGRSLKDLINTLDELGTLGIDFLSYENQLDTSTPTGKLVFHVIGAVAEFEKDIIRERVKAGLENAKRKGKKLGRPSVSNFLLEKAKTLRSEGLSYRKIGKRLGVDEGTIRKRVEDGGLIREGFNIVSHTSILAFLSRSKIYNLLTSSGVHCVSRYAP